MTFYASKHEESLIIKIFRDSTSLELIHFLENLLFEKLEMFINEQKGKILQFGSGTKDFNKKLLQRMSETSRLIIIEPSSYLLDEIRMELGSEAEGRIFYKSGVEWEKLPFDNDVFQIVISLFLWNKSPNKMGLLSEIYRILLPSGAVFLTAFLRDSLREIFDLYSEVLNQFDLNQFAGPLQKARQMFLTEEDYVSMLDENGFKKSEITRKKYVLRFSNSKELFSAPILCSLWLPVLEKVAGSESERIFWHLRQSMDKYYGEKKIPLTINAGVIAARK